MSERAMARMIAPFARRISGMLARGAVAAADAAGKVQRLQLRLLADEVKGDMEHAEPYGFTAVPHAGAEALAAFLGGDRSHGVVIAVSDRRYRVAGLAAGEVCVYDDVGHRVTLTRAGIVIDGGGHVVTVTNTSKLRVEADIEATGEITDRVSTGGKSMANMRNTYNTHTHPGDSGGTTGQPNQGM